MSTVYGTYGVWEDYWPDLNTHINIPPRPLGEYEVPTSTMAAWKALVEHHKRLKSTR